MTTPQELRRCRRLHIGRLVAGKLVPSGAPIKIVDISVGGFAMETSFPVRLGAMLDFRFTSKEGASFILKARVAHRRRIAASVGPDSYVTGLEFADEQTPSSHEAITVLLEKVNWILSFYDENQGVSDSAAGSDRRRSSPASGRKTATNGRVGQR